MFNNKSILLIIVFLSFFSVAEAQEKKDSIYYKIEEFSDKRKFTRFIHRFIFRREADSASVATRTEKQSQESYDGKFIRDIKIETIDPFGYNTKKKKRKRNGTTGSRIISIPTPESRRLIIIYFSEKVKLIMHKNSMNPNAC
jgi:hypothetical protein